MNTYTILAINPGSTSTKLGVYQNDKEVFREAISHSPEELKKCRDVHDQMAFRLELIKEKLSTHGMSLNQFSAIVGRGGLLSPLSGGVYLVNEKMLGELSRGEHGEHASNLGAILANCLAQEYSLPAFIVDPVVVDELDDIARITGRPEIRKRSIFHALNQKAVAKRYAQSLRRPYESLNLIVAHLGGGISVGCHRKGRVVEVNNALDGDGPFSPERTGTVQAGAFADLIIDSQLNKPTVKKLLAGQGGLMAYFNTQDAREIEARIRQSDKEAEVVYDAMIYQIARAIAAAAVPVKGQVDCIIITGGLAYSNYIVDKLKDYVNFIAPVVVSPGEDELQALAEGAYRALSGAEPVLEY